MITVIIIGGDRVARFSTQREIISQIILGEGKHMTAEEIAMKAKKVNPIIGIATVYRNLNTLVEEGKIKKVRDNNQGFVYDSNNQPHYHFECTECGAMYDLPNKYNEKLDDVVRHELKLDVANHKTTFYGTCKKCLMMKEEDTWN